MIRGVVFDLDDTLFLERDFVFSGFKSVGRWVESNLGPRNFADLAIERFAQGERRTVFDSVLESIGVEKTVGLIQKLVEEYRSHFPDIVLCPDADKALSRIAEKFRTGIISDGYLQTQMLKVEALGLSNRVETILLTDRWGREHWKPSSRAFLEMQMSLGLSGSECIYVGDNPTKDFVALASLGWSGIRVRRPGGEHFGVSGPGDEISLPEISDLKDLEKIIAQMSNLRSTPPK